jgi:hypothetical protein
MKARISTSFLASLPEDVESIDADYYWYQHSGHNFSRYHIGCPSCKKALMPSE